MQNPRPSYAHHQLQQHLSSLLSAAAGDPPHPSDDATRTAALSNLRLSFLHPPNRPLLPALAPFLAPPLSVLLADDASYAVRRAAVSAYATLCAVLCSLEAPGGLPDGFVAWALPLLGDPSSAALVSEGLRELLATGDVAPVERFVPPLLAACRDVLEDERTSLAVLRCLLGLLMLIAAKFPHCFRPQFVDIMDLLLGWVFVPDLADADRSMIMDSFLQFQWHWLGNLQFSLGLLPKFLADMEVLVHDPNLAVSHNSGRLRPLFACFSTVLQIMASGVAERNNLRELVAGPLEGLAPQLLRCASVIASKIGWSERMEEASRCLVLLAEILQERFAEFYILFVDVWAQSLEVASSAQLVAALKTNLQVLSMQNLGLRASSVGALLDFSSILSKLRLHPNNTVVANSAATYLFCLQHGLDDVVDQAIASLMKELELIKSLLEEEQVLLDKLSDPDSNVKDAFLRCHETDSLVGLQKWAVSTFYTYFEQDNQPMRGLSDCDKHFSWMSGLIYQSQGQYEKAAAHYSHLLQSEEALTSMKSDGIQFIIERVIECYTSLSDWKCLESWLAELQVLRAVHAGKPYSGALTSAGNELNAIHAMACFDNGDFNSAWGYLDLTPKSSSELTLDPKVALERSELMLLRGMLQSNSKLDGIKEELDKAKLMLDEALSVAPLNGFPEAAACADDEKSEVEEIIRSICADKHATHAIHLIEAAAGAPGFEAREGEEPPAVLALELTAELQPSYHHDALKGKTRSYTMRAMLYLLHIMLNYGAELKETLESGVSAVPLLPWQEIIPQLFARLSSHPEKIVRELLESILLKLGKLSPYSIVYPTLVDINACEGEPSEELQHISNFLVKLFPDLIKDVKLAIEELGMITVLWEEQWLSTLQDLHSDVLRRINILKEEAARVAANSTLSSAEKNKINAAKYSAVMTPIIVALERRLASTSREPKTSHEMWFHKEYNAKLKSAITTLKTPPGSPAALGDIWQPFDSIAASLATHQRKSCVLLSEIAPQLAVLSTSDIPMPGFEKQILDSSESFAGNHGTVTVSSFCKEVTILSTKTRPKKLVLQGSDGQSNGDVVHIDYNICFDKGRRLKIPEIVPFRLTQTIESALGLTGVEGVFRVTCEEVMDVLLKNKDIILMLLEVFVWDPLMEWTRGNIQDEAGIAGEEKKGMELAVSLSLFSSRIQEIRVPLQEHKDLFLTNLPATVSALKKFLDTLDHYEIASAMFYHAEKERSSVLQNEMSAKSVLADATSVAEKSRTSFEIHAHELAEAKAAVVDEANKLQIWREKHARVMEVVDSISEIRGYVDKALEKLVEVELEKTSLTELEQSYSVKVGRITQQQIALEEAAARGREHLSWEEAEELASQEEICRAQLEQLHETWSQKDMRISSLMKVEDSIINSLLSSKQNFSSLLDHDQESKFHFIQSKALLSILTKPFADLESLDPGAEQEWKLGQLNLETAGKGLFSVNNQVSVVSVKAKSALGSTQIGTSDNLEKIGALMDDKAEGEGPGATDQETRDSNGKNPFALSILKQVEHKLHGRDIDGTRSLNIPEQVDYLLKQATSIDNLCNM
nr:unnamed protein product [Digitaria exilis]